MEYIIFFAAMLVLILLFFIKGYCDYRKEEKNFINSLYENYGKMQEREYKPEEFRNISKYYQKHKQDFNIDDITWNDLGMDEVFKKINFTHSAAGEEYLYYTLRTPEKSISSLTHKEEIITAFCSDKDERVRLQFILSKLGRCGKFSIHDYLDYLDELGVRSNTKHYLALLALIFSISVIFVNLPFGLLLLVCVVIFNNITYFREKNNIDPYITSFAYIFRMLDTAQKVQKNKINALTEENSTLELCCKKLDGYKRGSFLLMSAGRMSGSGNPLELLLDFIRMGFHLDLIKFNQMLSQVRLHANDIDQIITVLGKIDSLIAIGEYRESLEHFCIPEFIESTGYEITDAYHPLISNPVKNSICTKNGILITGSNASGKSTFLKTIAINTILAQSIHTCLSSTYKSSLFRICSSMSLRDDVEGGSSYYMVEIKSIKRILDFMTNESELPVLCLECMT